MSLLAVMDAQTRRGETVAVRRAVEGLGFPRRRVAVKHGTGTAWGWLNVDVTCARPVTCRDPAAMWSCGDPVGTCPACREHVQAIERAVRGIVAAVSGRRGGDYDGKTLVHVERDSGSADRDPQSRGRSGGRLGGGEEVAR